jgi:hypothetical protein
MKGIKEANGYIEYKRKQDSGGASAKEISTFSEKKSSRITAGKCCVCGITLERNPDRAASTDDMARFCVNCGTDICVYCLKKQAVPGGDFVQTCPVCNKDVIFEINPLCRPK